MATPRKEILTQSDLLKICPYVGKPCIMNECMEFNFENEQWSSEFTLNFKDRFYMRTNHELPHRTLHDCSIALYSVDSLGFEYKLCNKYKSDVFYHNGYHTLETLPEIDLAKISMEVKHIYGFIYWNEPIMTCNCRR